MAILEQITQMRNQGISDADIVRKLQEQGISPREISDALDQSKIKNAVMGENYSPPSPNQTQQNYAPQTQEMPEAQQPQQEYSSQEYAQPQQQYYQQDQYAYPQEATDSEIIIEISEQVFAEKIKKIKKQVEEINEFKILAETKIDNIAERLKRIETIIDRLQVSILEKIGSYGENLNSIKKEMSMMQDSFGKVVNQAVKGQKVSRKK